jgi:hypothetical protein
MAAIAPNEWDTGRILAERCREADRNLARVVGDKVDELREYAEGFFALDRDVPLDILRQKDFPFSEHQIRRWQIKWRKVTRADVESDTLAWLRAEC